jgi:hypothetical protein
MAFGAPSQRVSAPLTSRTHFMVRTTAALPFCAAMLGAVLFGKGLLGAEVDAAKAEAPTSAAAAKPTGTVKSIQGGKSTGRCLPARDDLASSGEPIYASPTAGASLDLSHFVPGAFLVVALRPAEIMAIPDKYRLLDPVVLGDWGPWFLDSLPKLAGTANSDIEQVILGVLEGPDSMSFRTACVIRTKEAIPEERLLGVWGDPVPTQIDDAKTFVKDGIAYYLPPAGRGKIIVIAPQAEMAEVIKYRGESPLLPRREMDMLLQSTDADRQLTILYTPYFFEFGGRSLVAGPAGRGIGPLNWLATGYGLPTMEGTAGAGAAPPPMPANPDDALPPKAVVFSAHFAENFFWELRYYAGGATADNDAPARAIADRVREIPSLVDTYLFEAQLTAYSRRMLLARFPPMVKFAARNTRAAAGEKQLVLRGYLPAKSVQNVALGTYLCLLEGPGAAPPTVVDTGNDHGKPPTALQALQYRMSFSFERNSVDFTLAKIAEQIGIPIEISKQDLMLEGITKGQSFGMDERDVTVDELLRKLFRKVNPDGKLVYQVKPTVPGGPDVIVITTRAAVQKRNESLLPVFETERFWKHSAAEVNEALHTKIRLAPFERDRIDLVLERISRQIGVSIVLIGPDLQLDGITKNQSFGWNEPELTVDETLRKIFMKANPDGNLVYLVTPNQRGSIAAIRVTTRRAVQKRGETLLPIFETAPPKK